MPTDFVLSFTTDDVVEANHVNQFGVPIQNLEQGQTWYGEGVKNAGMAADDYAVTINASSSDFSPALQAGMMVHFKADAGNTQPVTVDVNGLGSVSVKKSVSQALEAGDIAAGQIAVLQHDGTNFQLLGGAGQVIHPVDLPSAIDADRFGAGTVSNTEFGYLDGLSSGVQSQVDATSALIPGDTDDLTEGTTNLYFTDARAVAALVAAENNDPRHKMQAVIDCNSTGSTLLGTVPTGKTFMPTDFYITDLGGISGSGTRPLAKCGSDGSHSNIRTSTTLGPSVGGLYQVVTKSGTAVHASNASIYFEVVTASTYAGYTVAVTLFGELY